MKTCPNCRAVYKTTETSCPHCNNTKPQRPLIPTAVLLGLGSIGLMSGCKQEPIEALYGVAWDSGELDIDEDGDGFSIQDGDCNDNDATIHPQAEETPDDDVDQNCDGEDNT